MYPHKQHQHAHQRHLQQAVRNRLTTVTTDRPAHAVLQSNLCERKGQRHPKTEGKLDEKGVIIQQVQ